MNTFQSDVLVRGQEASRTDPTDFVADHVRIFPDGTRYRVIVQVLPTPDPDGWVNATTETPPEGLIVVIKDPEGVVEHAKVEGGLWMSVEDEPLFFMPVAWMPTYEATQRGIEVAR